MASRLSHEAYLSELTELRDRLKATLSGGNSESDDETGPGSFGVTDKIKALKATNTIEATPQRIERKESSAEEPVTVRIRRRQEANTEDSEEVHAGHAPATEAANENHPTDNDNHPRNGSTKPLTFQERIALERQRQDQGPSLP